MRWRLASMFNLFESFSSQDNITKFLNSLDYWQQLNLYIMLYQVRAGVSYEDAKSEALANVMDQKNLHYLLEEAINSPGPRRESTKEFIRKAEEKAKDELIDTLIKRINVLENCTK